MRNIRSARRSSIKINSHPVEYPNGSPTTFIVLVKEFSQSTSMHGIHYISQEEASLLERILWFILFCIGVFFSGLLSFELWKNWDISPVLITLQSVNYPINKYPFPSVTFCSTNKVSTRALGQWIHSQQGRGFTDLELDDIRRILQIISTNRVDDESEIIHLSSIMERANISSNDRYYEKLMRKLSPNCSEMAIHCAWENKEENCTDMIETESTDDGYCCSFNSVILYRNRSTNHKNLRYSSNQAGGVYSGLSLILNAELEDYNVSSSTTIGFKVSIQAPDDFASTGKIGFLASPGRQTDAAVTGETQISSKTVRSIDVTKRHCVLADEIQLTYFSHYTRPYCQLDCLTRFFLSVCQCVPYYFPVPEDLPVCNISSYLCLERVMEMQARNTTSCNCPEDCNQVWYWSEISTGFYPNPVSFHPRSIRRRPEFRDMTQSEFQEYSTNNFLKVNVYFKTPLGVSYILDERMTWTNFLAATGGILGLGFGFSLLSFAEIVYFIGFRWIYYWWKNRKAEKRIDARSLIIANIPSLEIAINHPDSSYSQDGSTAGESRPTTAMINSWIRDDRK